MEKLFTAQALNADCQCLPLNRAELDRHLVRTCPTPEKTSALLATRENLLAATPVFVSHADVQAMIATAQALENIVALPAYQSEVAARGGDFAPQGAGIFTGLDFHLTTDGPKLIEINTNAGGGVLLAALWQGAALEDGCCGGTSSVDPKDAEAAILSMIEQEWQAANLGRTLKTIAIIDDNPEEEYLYPELILARALLAKNGQKVVIVDPSAVHFDGQALWAGDTQIDLVYNRLTDFTLSQPNHQALHAAWLTKAAVISPNPTHFALYADKQNLIGLSNPAILREWGAQTSDVAALQSMLPTRRVTPENADDLWAMRKKLFFKPVASFGSRGAYRGDKLTKRVWQTILDGDYVAQDCAPPSLRRIPDTEQETRLKFDVRLFAYGGKAFLFGARLYQGQTTNFRTPGGGLAQVIETNV